MVEKGKTELVKNNLNPDFATSVQIDFIFESKQTLLLEVWDQDKNTRDLIGTASTQVSKVMGGKHSSQVMDIHDKKGHKTGEILVRGERVNDNHDVIELGFDAKTDHERGFMGGDTKPRLSLHRQ